VKKCKIIAITAFKVIQGHRGRYQSKACMWFPIPISFGGLGTTYDVHLGLIWKSVVDFLLAFTELFSLGVTADALRAKIDRKSAILLLRDHFNSKFQVEGVAPHQSFLHG